MSRVILAEQHIHPNIQNQIGGSKYRDTLEEVLKAVETHQVVVVGMAQNPVCKRVRKQLEEANIEFHYLEYGSYLKEWRRRLVLKMWTGWSTFPMVFIKGQLIGGSSDLQKILDNGEIQQLLQ